MQRRVVLHMFGAMDTESHPKTLSLLEALVLWTAPALVAKLKMRERHYSPADLAYFTSMTRRPRLSDESELRKTGPHEWMIGTPDYGMLIAAHKELEQDFRDRMTRSEFHLRGVQTRPTLTTEVRSIAGAWAAECTFEFAAGCLTVSNMRFASVTVSRVPETDTDDGHRPDQVNMPEIESGGTEPRIAPGRASFEPLIREALNDRWDDVRKGVENGQSWVAIADWLWKHLDKKYPGWAHSKKLPSAYTIRTRLSRWYPAELANRTVQ